MTPLVAAIRSGKIGQVRAALRADPTSARDPGAVLCAAGQAFLPALELLHKHGADLNTPRRNYRPLHALLQENPHEAAGKPSAARLECLDWLLAHGADPELTGAWPAARAVIVACFVGENEYVSRLRRTEDDAFAAAALGDVELLSGVLRKRPAFARERDGAGGLTALQCAAGSRMPGAGARLLEAATMLLDTGADAEALTRSWAHQVDAAYFAAVAPNPAIFELLLNRGVDPTGALVHPVWAKHFEMAALALERGASIDRAVSGGRPLLNDLIRWGQIPQAQWLIERGASPNVADEKGWTAVHQAASRGNLRLLQAVLDAGGDRSRRDTAGKTPRNIATAVGRDKLAALLAVR